LNIDESVLTGVTIYLCIGVAVTGLFFVDHLRKRRTESEWMKEVRDTLYPERKKFWYRFTNNILAPVLAGLAMTVLWPVALCLQVTEYLKQKRSTDLSKPGLQVGLDHLLEKVTVDEVIARETVADPLGGAPAVPFGHLNACWEEFVSGLSLEDELWTFRSESLGRILDQEPAAGYALVRGEVVLRYMLA